MLLTDADTARIDQVDYPEQTADVSFGRFPNGTGDFIPMTPTFSAENTNGNVSTRYPELTGVDVTLFPNPATNAFTVRLDRAYTADLTVRLYGADGRLLRNERITRGGTDLTFDASMLPAGIYFVAVLDGRAARTLRLRIE